MDKLDLALFEKLFPSKEQSKLQSWLTVLLNEEFETLQSLGSLDDSSWAQINLPLAVKTILKQAAAPALAPTNKNTNTDPSSNTNSSTNNDPTTNHSEPAPAYSPPTNTNTNDNLTQSTPTTTNTPTSTPAPAATPVTSNKDAITQIDMIVMDISSSMKARSGIDPLKTREDMSKLLFHTMVDKLVSLELNHAVGLEAFGMDIHKTIGITRQYEHFHDHLGRLDARENSTKLWDAIYEAGEELLVYAEKERKNLQNKETSSDGHPCYLRIFCLTDGEDNSSTKRAWEVAKFLQKHGIILDSIPLAGSNSTLQSLSTATNGLCLTVNSEEQGLRLFEREAVLHVAYRETGPTIAPVESANDLAKLVDNGLVITDVQAAVPSQVKSRVLTATEIEKKIALVNTTITTTTVTTTSTGVKSDTATPAVNHSGAALRRIMKEYTDIVKDPLSISEVYISAEDCFFWKILLRGPNSTPYENCSFILSAQFPQDYPFKPPKIRFLTPVYHCNINSDGGICLDILKDNWSPALTISKVIISIHSLLTDPNANDALDAFKAQLYRQEKERYIKEATAHSIKHGGGPIDEILNRYNINK